MADYGGPKQFGGSFLVIFQMLLEPNHIHSTYIYIYIPVVPHKAVAEVSKIGNL